MQTAANSTRLATKHAPHGSPSSPASVAGTSVTYSSWNQFLVQKHDRQYTADTAVVDEQTIKSRKPRPHPAMKRRFLPIGKNGLGRFAFLASSYSKEFFFFYGQKNGLGRFAPSALPRSIKKTSSCRRKSFCNQAISGSAISIGALTFRH